MPPIEAWKAQVGFAPGNTALYKSWRDAAKLQMTHLGISGKKGSGQKWDRLTEWALKKRPFSSQAHHHETPGYAAAVQGLLVDVAKKRSYTLSKRVSLDSPRPPRPQTRKYHLIHPPACRLTNVSRPPPQLLKGCPDCVPQSG